MQSTLWGGIILSSNWSKAVNYMPTKNGYNPLRYGCFIVLCAVVSGVVLGLVSKFFEINLFEEFGGVPGFFILGLLFYASQEAELRCQAWLKMASSSSRVS